ncbi:uncharacterized protein EV420DRAFT_1694887 [Desarmillaria tabescens]|uniref:MARVEL domain-containing protein n=1 Tax=Armillaria tabescens TaxID=1929756 RepID=A0AA39KAR1_ARMTA|nr:uncharacterized protein EV420DRAFT_1694887 [Desarmillaria tabescens]KAK0455338.1 hypothetical protein EV420DRAFT_1694887 [Desarmillaria tabescens]
MSNAYSIYRVLAYAWLWAVACVLLGLTAYRIHITEGFFLSFYEPIIVELLVSACLAIIWAPIAGVLALSEHNTSHKSGRFRSEMLGTFVLWVMWLVGAVDTTNRIIPGKNYCRSGKQCQILTTLMAFSWIGWSFLTIIGTIGLMYHAYSSGKQSPIRDREKAAEAAGNT